jgi:hypothetical protein
MEGAGRYAVEPYYVPSEFDQDEADNGDNDYVYDDRYDSKHVGDYDADEDLVQADESSPVTEGSSIPPLSNSTRNVPNPTGRNQYHDRRMRSTSCWTLTLNSITI